MAEPIRKGGRNQPRAGLSKRQPSVVVPVGKSHLSQSTGEVQRLATGSVRWPAPGITEVVKVSEVLKRIAPVAHTLVRAKLEFIPVTRSPFWPIRREFSAWPNIVDPDGMARAFLANFPVNSRQTIAAVASPQLQLPEGVLTLDQYCTLNNLCSGELRETYLWEELMHRYPTMPRSEAMSIQLLITNRIAQVEIRPEFLAHLLHHGGDYRELAGRYMLHVKLPDRIVEGVPIAGIFVSFDYRMFAGFVPNSTFKIKSGLTIYYDKLLTNASDLYGLHGIEVVGYTQIASATLATPNGEATVQVSAADA